jgi:hypothetical protein
MKRTTTATANTTLTRQEDTAMNAIEQETCRTTCESGDPHGETELPVYGVNVRDCGARGDGTGDDAPALQRALDSGAPVVVVPYGSYRLASTLRIRSGTRLHAHPCARLLQAEGAGRDSSCFVLENADPANGDRDIAVEGGIWDGNAAANVRGPDAPGSYTGVLLNFFNVRGLVLRNVELRNPVSYHTRFCRIRDFRIEHVRFRTTVLRPNQDGIHLGGECEDGTIRHIDSRGVATTGDDLVALNADDANGRAQNLGKVNGFIRRVRIYDLAAEDCHSFVRLLSFQSPIEAIDVEDVRGGCRVCALNMDAARKCLVPLYDPDDPAYADGVGSIRKVRCSDLRIHRTAPQASNALIDVLSRVDVLVVEDFVRDVERDAAPHVPTLAIGSVPSTRIAIEGLDAGQLAGLARKSTSTRLEAAREAWPAADRARFRVVYRAEMTTALTLPHGGFRHLGIGASFTPRSAGRGDAKKTARRGGKRSPA